MQTRNIITTIFLAVFCSMVGYAQNFTLSTPDITVPSDREIPLNVNLDNSADIVAVQFTITLPDGLWINTGSSAATDRTASHSVNINQWDGNKYTVIVISSDNTPIKGRTGAIMTMPLYANSYIDEGTVFQPVLSDVAIVARDGSNLTTGFSAGTVTIAQNPDLQVSDVTISATEIAPGDKITMSWKVENVGAKATAGGGWTEDLYLEMPDGTDQYLSSANHEGILTSGATMARSADIVLPDVLWLDGDVRAKVRLSANYEAAEPYWLTENNTARSEAAMNLARRLYLTPTAYTTEEGHNEAVQYRLTRSARYDRDGIFTIKFSADSRISLPESITIPQWDNATYFYVTVKSNGLIDDNDTFPFTVEGEGFEPVSATLSIVDDTFPHLSLSARNQEIEEGGKLELTISIARALSHDLEVKLSCDLTSRFKIPASIIIPAGKTSVDVTVETVDDDIPDIERAVVFTASAAAQQPATLDVILADNDIPALELSLTPSTVSEGAGPLAVTGTLRRTDNSDKLVTIRLEDDSNGGIYFPIPQMEMAPGVEEITFNLGPVDNAVVEGERTYNVSASVFIASCSCNATNGKSGGTVSAPLTVTDNDGPTLSLSSGSSVLQEGGEISALITRNTPSDSPLTVALSSDKAGEISFPSSVTIPAGSESVEFTIKSTGNETTGDGFDASIVCEAEGYAKGVLWITITDNTLPDAQLRNLSVSPTEVEAGGFVTVGVTLANTGSYYLPEMTKVDFFVNNSYDPVASYYLQDPLQPGSEISIEKNIEMPSSVGKFSVYANVNRDHDVKELSYSNNSSELIAVNVVAPFSATVATDKTAYLPGEKVAINGRLSGVNGAYENVEIYVINHGYRHRISAQSDGEGNFSAEYEPYAGQLGEFAVGACYPGENLREPMASFNVLGMARESSSAITCEVTMGEPYKGKFSIVNPSSLPLTGLKADILSQPSDCELLIDNNDRIAGGESADIAFTINPIAVSSGNDWEKIELNITASEGVSLPVCIYYYTRIATGQLKSSVTSIRTTMVKGASRDYVFEIGNIGKGSTGKITLALPEWMKAATPVEMAPLKNGETATVILRLTPTDDMQLNVPVTGNIGINCEGGAGLSIPYSIEPVSESKGVLTIDVCDENTYYTAEAPHVAGAKVSVTHPTTGAVISEGVTGADGKYSVEIPEGYYAVAVSADKHDSYRNNFMVDPGTETVKTVNLSMNAITVDWKVEETTVEDEYEIVTTVKYETSVPVPVVETVVPKLVPAKDLMPGESLVFYATLTNKGLITAQDVDFILPTGFKALSFEKLDHTEPFSLAPGQSVRIPVRVTHLTSPLNSPARVRPIDDDPCAAQPGTLYFWECGLDRKWHRYGVAMQLGTCYSPDPSTWDNSGNGNGNGGIVSTWGWGYGWGPGGLPSGGVPSGGYHQPSQNQTNVSERKTYDCEPCQNKFLLDLVRCIPYLGSAVTAAEEAGEAGKCVRAATSNLSNMDKLRNCKYTKDIPDGLEFCENFVNGANKLLRDSKDNQLTDKEFEAVKKTLEKTAEDAIDHYLSSGSSSKKERVAKEFLQKSKDLIQKAEKLRNDAISDDANWEKCYKDLAEATASLGELAAMADPDLAERIIKAGKWVKKYTCIVPLLEPCDLEGDTVPIMPDSPSAKTQTSRKAKSNSTTDAFIRNMKMVVQLLEYGDEYIKEIFGDECWLDVPTIKRMPILVTAFGENKPIDESGCINAYKPEEISSSQFSAFIKRWNNSFFSDSEVKGLIDFGHLDAIFDECFYLATTLENSGSEGIEEILNKNISDAQAEAEKSSSSVCASITLQFDQKMVMTRQAFRGTLTVFNGNEEKPMENVRLNLVVKDSDGVVATEHELQIAPESIDGFQGNLSLTDGWILDPQQTGSAKVIFIPTKYAAPTADKVYSFGGSLSYTDPYSGLEVTRELLPVALTVKPSPNLNMTYFVQRDVLGDDPLTEAIEPSEEAEFSLLIHNVGYGDATDIRMTTEQPKITSNDKGLDIDFEIISSQLNGGERSLALGKAVATEFGDIPSMQTAYAQWWMKSSILGHFTDYDVKATHVSSYGNPDLSLLNDVTVHELIRSLDVEIDGKRGVGFMTNDIIDANDMPDMIYLSDGSVQPVGLFSGATMTENGENTYLLTLDATRAGWGYGSVADPTYGVSEIVSVVRNSDGKEMSLRNFWQTDRTLRDGQDPTYENRLHFADILAGGGSETYTVTFAPSPSLLLDVVSIEGVPTEGVVTGEPITKVNVMFNKYIDPTTFTADDLAMKVEGSGKDLAGMEILTEDGKTFTLDLSATEGIADEGYHVLTVNTADITDTEGFPGKNGKTASWTYYPSGSVLIGASVYPENAGLISVEDVDSDSEAVVSISSDYHTPAPSVVINASYGEYYHLTAIPNEGYEFCEWTDADGSSYTSDVIKLKTLGNASYTANFSPKTFAVDIDTMCEGGTVTGAYTGIYPYGEELTVMAVPEAGYAFSSWIINGEPLKEDSVKIFTVKGDTSVSALFEKESGIGNVGEDKRVVVYTVDGILISDDATAEILRGLERGIYIINGLKVIIR